MSEDAPNADDIADSNRKRTRSRLLVLVVLFVAIAAALHPWILTKAYQILLVDESMVGCRMAMIADPTPECMDLAAELIAGGSVDRILIVTMKPLRSARIGAVVPIEQSWTSGLADRGVPETSIQVISTNAVTQHEKFRQLNGELARNPSPACVVLSTSTLSRYYRTVIDQAVEMPDADKFRLKAVPETSDEESTWWRSRHVTAKLLNHGLRLAFATTSGESNIDPDDPYRHLYASSVQ